MAGWAKRWALVAPEGRAAHDRRGRPAGRGDPRSPHVAILHNDYKVDNCQFDPTQPDRVRSIFDWDMATLGDPFVDLGTLLNYWPDPADAEDVAALVVPGLESLGLPTRAEVVERYAEVTGFGVEDVHWYEAFASWKTAVVLEQLHMRYVRGESTDERMADKGELMARQAAGPPPSSIAPGSRREGRLVTGRGARGESLPSALCQAARGRPELIGPHHDVLDPGLGVARQELGVVARHPEVAPVRCAGEAEVGSQASDGGEEAHGDVDGGGSGAEPAVTEGAARRSAAGVFPPMMMGTPTGRRPSCTGPNEKWVP